MLSTSPEATGSHKEDQRNGKPCRLGGLRGRIAGRGN
jgi:hypothetical protein